VLSKVSYGELCLFSVEDDGGLTIFEPPLMCFVFKGPHTSGLFFREYSPCEFMPSRTFIFPYFIISHKILITNIVKMQWKWNAQDELIRPLNDVISDLGVLVLFVIDKNGVAREQVFAVRNILDSIAGRKTPNNTEKDNRYFQMVFQ
jgi:hypothetical protein